MLNINEIKKMDKKAIETKVLELKKQLFDLNLQKITSAVEKPHVFKNIKKDIARLMTVAKQSKK
jgi:large subunit ribosomal protein L29